jgi:hypothetical protein
MSRSPTRVAPASPRKILTRPLLELIVDGGGVGELKLFYWLSFLMQADKETAVEVACDEVFVGQDLLVQRDAGVNAFDDEHIQARRIRCMASFRSAP